mgnify:CR=1 FL=1
MMKLYIIRHGETDWNTQGRMQGQTDIALNEKGIRLAKVTAEGMKDIAFDLCITSPLKRARQTAEIILAGKKIPVLEEKRIQEISFGDWEGVGCRKENYELPVPFEEFQKFYKDPFHYEPDNSGESIAALCERTADFWEELTENEALADKTILIATHGCAMRALLHNVYPDKEDFWHGQVPVNCAVNIVEVENKKAVLLEDDKIYYDPKEAVNFFKAE